MATSLLMDTVVVTLQGPSHTDQSRPIIAPYWADVDTRSGSGRVYHGETTSSSLRSRAAGLVRRIYRTSFYPTHLFIATWKRVGYYYRHTDKVDLICPFTSLLC